jgi:hypothetical protein
MLDDQGEYSGVRFAFVDVPTGPAMFELLESTSAAEGASIDANASGLAEGLSDNDPDVVALDRATIVTPNIDDALRFYSYAFRWHDVRVETQILRCGECETRMRRLIGRAGTLELELIQPEGAAAAYPEAEDPYSKHLVRGPHGLVHAGGSSTGSLPSGASASGEWVETGERFSLYDWAGGRGALQIRTSTSS